MEKLVNDIGSIRAHLNSTELQLYEANEKVAELLEIVSRVRLLYNVLRIIKLKAFLFCTSNTK